MYLRIAAILFALIIHGAVGYAMLPHLMDTSAPAMDMGKGMDVMLVQGAESNEGVTKGDSSETREIPEISAMQAAPPPPPEEKKPDELRDVISSPEGTVEQQVVKTEEPPPPPDTPPPPPEVVQTITQPAQVAVLEVRSAGQASGGNAKAFGRYMSQINDRVQKAKRNPRVPASGTVVLRYTIGVDGHILSKEIATSSGFKQLDDAATDALDRAAPFPPIPPDVSVKPLAFTQPFKFIMR
ncbi:energy transducer TonB [Hyphomicrobium sp. MC8b]|uniref:energy transducer TonB family protein n=1 Tax=Hyphomicrobium sp. MC8b TaxID=300273 RepID=UPI00391A789C